MFIPAMQWNGWRNVFFNYYWRIKWILRWTIIIIETRIHQNGNQHDIICIIKMEFFFSFWRYSMFQGWICHLSERLKWANKLQDHGIFGHNIFWSGFDTRWTLWVIRDDSSDIVLLNDQILNSHGSANLFHTDTTNSNNKKIICICKQHEWTRAMNKAPKHQNINKFIINKIITRKTNLSKMIHEKQNMNYEYYKLRRGK